MFVKSRPFAFLSVTVTRCRANIRIGFPFRCRISPITAALSAMPALIRQGDGGWPDTGHRCHSGSSCRQRSRPIPELPRCSSGDTTCGRYYALPGGSVRLTIVPVPCTTAGVVPDGYSRRICRDRISRHGCRPIPVAVALQIDALIRDGWSDDTGNPVITSARHHYRPP